MEAQPPKPLWSHDEAEPHRTGSLRGGRAANPEINATALVILDTAMSLPDTACLTRAEQDQMLDVRYQMLVKEKARVGGYTLDAGFMRKETLAFQCENFLPEVIGSMAEPVLKKMDAFRVAGFSVRTLNEKEMEPETAKIPGLWQRVLSGELTGLLKPGNGANLYAVYSGYEGDHTQPYTLTVGYQIDADASAPERTSAVDVPFQSYLVFTASGEPPQSIINAWGEIWTFFDGNPDYARTYSHDFELYGGPDRDTEIYIAITESPG